MKWIAFIICLIIPSAALALTVEGNSYEDSVTIKGHELKLIGAGLREIYGFNVYTLGAYSETGGCEDQEIIDKEEVKYLRLNILRNIDSEKVVRRINEAFNDSLPPNVSPNLLKHRDQSFSYFKGRCLKGTVFEFIYIPGTGTIFKQNGKIMGPTIPGKEYHTAFWNVYFGKKTCCSELKDQLLVKCRPEQPLRPMESDDPYSVYRN
ncbi:MAG: chalcone isomerase family protein [Desulfobacteraceae bacterium]|nr:chalcone isomerase family protein [Desulfobacteraceae bacterium]